MNIKVAELYDQDFNLWREKTIAQIRANQFQEVDWQHLLIELEDMGKSERRVFTSNLMVLLAHLLKLKVPYDAPESMKISWYESVDEHRTRVKKDLAENSSFKNWLTEAIDQAYRDGRKIAINQGKRASFGVRVPSLAEYPMQCPFSLDEILDDDFYGF